MSDPFSENNQYNVIFILMRLNPHVAFISGYPNPFYFLIHDKQVAHQLMMSYFMKYMNLINNNNNNFDNNTNCNTNGNTNGNTNCNTNFNNNCNTNFSTNNNDMVNNDNSNNNNSNNNNILNPFPELNINMGQMQMEQLLGGGNNSTNINDNSNIAQNNQNNQNNPNNNFNQNNMNINQNTQTSPSTCADSDDHLKLMDQAIDSLKENIKSKDKNENTDEEIEITFSFSNGPSIPIKVKINEMFENVIKKFCQIETNREIMKKFYSICIHNYSLVWNNKTVYENNIKNGDFVLFYREKKKDHKESDLDEDEKEQIMKWLEEYKANILCKYYNNTKSKNKKKDIKLKFNKDEFVAFVTFKNKELNIKVREHEHKLVYSLTNFNWKCNKCKKDYSQKEAKYYCSLCDYCMCDKCRKKGNYNKKKSFPENVPPCDINYKEKFLKTKFHQHNLVLSRTSRKAIGSTPWFCNGCRTKFNNETWSFYCTKCDFDLCSNCAGIH